MSEEYTLRRIVPHGDHIWTARFEGKDDIPLSEQSDFALYVLSECLPPNRTMCGIVVSEQVSAAASALLRDRYPHQHARERRFISFRGVMASGSSLVEHAASL
jgi:hypothetical protein